MSNKEGYVQTPEFRISFPNVFEEDENGKYTVQMLFPKDTNLAEIKSIVKKAIEVKWGEDKDKWPKGLVMPLKDGDKKADEDERYENSHRGMIAVNASSQYPPVVGIISNGVAKELFDKDDFYAGAYGAAIVNAYTWEHKNDKGKVIKRGVSLGFSHVAKTRDGEPFGDGKQSLGEAFGLEDGAPSGKDDPNNYEGGSGDDDIFGM